MSCRAHGQLIEYAQLCSRAEAGPNILGREESAKENHEKEQTQ